MACPFVRLWRLDRCQLGYFNQCALRKDLACKNCQNVEDRGNLHSFFVNLIENQL